MDIGMIDVDNRDNIKGCFPNLAIMKLSSWHKSQGDTVQWYEPMEMKHYDKVYMSKVFSFTPDYEYYVDADEVIKGGSGYCISLVNGKEVYDKSKDIQLPNEVEHAFPDYGLYGIKAYVDMNQGVDIRMMTEEKADMLRQIKLSRVHFAYDRFQDKEMIEPRFRTLKEVTGWTRSKVMVYVLCGFDTTMEQNLDRIMFLRSLDFQPYVMLYDKEHIPKGHELRKLQRWVNSPYIFWSCPTFDEYQRR